MNKPWRRYQEGGDVEDDDYEESVPALQQQETWSDYQEPPREQLLARAPLPPQQGQEETWSDYTKPPEETWSDYKPEPGAPRFVPQGEEKPKPAPGIWESFTGGLERGVSGLAQTGELAINKLLGRPTETGTEEPPVAAADISPLEIPFSPISKGLPWLAYGVGRGAPALAGGIAGGAAGAAGIIAGSGLGQFLTDVGPKYRDAVQEGVPEDKALTDSLVSAGVSGVATGASFGAFGLPGSWLTHLLMQPTLIQPTIAGTEHAVQNYLAGKPLTEGVGEAALGGALGGLIPAGGHKAATAVRGEVRPAVEPPVARSNEAGPAEPSTRAVPATEPDIHGKPSAEAAPGTAEPQPKPPDVGGPRDRQGPEDYGKETPARAPGGGLNVGEVDPTIAEALKPRSPGEAAPQAAAPAARLEETVREPAPAPAPAPRTRQDMERQPLDLQQRATQELHALGNDPKTTTLMREAVIEELQRRQAGGQQAQPAPQPPPTVAPAAAPETGRLRVARNPDSTWAVKNQDGTIVSTHPNADQAIRAARAAVPAAPAEVVRGPAPAVEAPSAMPRAGTPVGKIGDFTIMRQPDGTWHAVDPATGRPLTEEPFATRKQAANAAHDEIQRRRETPAEELGAEAEPVSAGAAATPAGATTSPKPGFRERMAVRVADLKTQASDAYRAGVDKLFDIGRDLQMKVAPMATGSQEAMALVKDHASWNRRIDHEWSVADNYLERTFKPEARKAMWDRADEENTMRQRGEVSEHMGIAALTPEERAAVESFQPKARELWEQYRQAGMVGEGAEGLPYYTPRMLMNIAEGGEGARTLDQRTSGVRTSAPGLKGRKYLEAEETEAAAKKKFGEEAAIARDIRAMPMALAQGEKALAGRQLINKIKEIGRATGEETVVEGQNPGKGWFHVNHPSFFTWRPRMEVADTPTYRAAAEARSGVAIPETKIPLLDRNGNMVFDKVPIWVRGDFEGPIKSFIHAEPGKAYKAAMELKGKTMAVVMISPMIHNLVEYGRAIPAAPGKVISTRIYFEGNAAKHGRPYTGALRYAYDHLFKGHEIPKTASPTMLEAVDSGMMPIGRRFFNQDITSMMEQPNLTPGRSLTAKILGLVPDLFNPAAGAAVKRAVDRMGDIWHNTLLWDRIGDLQMGLYVHARDTMVKKGVDSTTAKYTAAHIANRYAGALPQEAMSSAAQKIANMTMFSRSFTLGNLGVMKDMLNGLPRDVRAQIARDLGQTDPRAANFARSMARRKAISIVAIDIGLMYVMNSALQSGMNMLLGDKTLNEEGQDYVRRFNDLMKQIKEDPLTVLQPFKMAESLSATYENEPDKQDRIRVSETPEGRAIYGRNPVGKIGEEFTGWMAHPAAKLQSKLSTIVRPIWKILDNDAGFGRKIYDPHPDTIAKYAGVVADIAKYFIAAQTPEGQLSAFKNLLTGEGNQKLNILQAIGPLAGVTFSKGHPGGPAAGELARMTEQHKYEVQKEMPEIQKLIQSGKDENIDRAIEKMDELKIPPGLQRFLLNPHISKRQVRDLYKYGTEEQINRFERARGYAEGGEVDDEGLLDMDPLNPWQDPVQKFDPDLPLGPYEDPRGRELIPDMDPKAPYRTPVYKDPGHRRQDKA